MKIDERFSQVSLMLFGKRLENVRDYGEWLLTTAHEARMAEKKSIVSARTVYVPSAKFFLDLGGRVMTADEALKHGEKNIAEAQAGGLSLANASGILSGISATTPEIIYSENIGTSESCAYGPTQHCYRVACCWFSKYIAYSYWTRTSDSLFGCSLCTDCSFSAKCYSSTKLTKCFEVNDSNRCSDSYFCHNCEDMSECMFCFNAKGKRYAIGNVEVGREKYMEIKRKVLASIWAELESAKSLKHDIYNLGIAGQ
ncbi:MAG TPA: hypothetical protein PLO51_02735 [Candidatus Micrarchaeota archaeon]|nr:hypothetical protein [Candidatus Micrarchaeota archaeon]